MEYGALNDHALKIILLEIVRRLALVVGKNRALCVEYDKEGFDGAPDVVTNIDTKAQALWQTMMQLALPQLGAIGEEAGFRVETRLDNGAYVTNDPIDGIYL